MDSQKNQDFPAATRPHILRMDHPAVQTPSKALPDGAITGNGDLTAILAGAADRVHIYIGKADFWNADCRAYAEHRGGLAPVGLAELLLPHLAYAAYHVEQDLDHARITLRLNEGKLWAELKIIVCATENTVLLELKHAHPMTSSSLSLLPLTDSDAIAECGSEGDVLFSLRGFDGTACRFASYGVCAMRQIERSISEGTERILWAISVCTQAIERAADIDSARYKQLLSAHSAHWEQFWSKSGVSLPDEDIETCWYAGLYAVACCAGNKKFPPGLWGVYPTSDGLGWYSDYHLNYNYEAPFYALASSNHPELLECYMAPFKDFLPTARRYAEEYLGIRGAYFPEHRSIGT